MTLEIFLWVLVAGLVVFTSVLTRAGLGDDRPTRDYPQGNHSPEHRDREEPHDDSPQLSKVAA